MASGVLSLIARRMTGRRFRLLPTGLDYPAGRALDTQMPMIYRGVKRVSRSFATVIVRQQRNIPSPRCQWFAMIDITRSAPRLRAKK